MKSQTLENLKICHKGRFLLFNKNSKVTGDEDNLLTNLIDLQIGINYEPIFFPFEMNIINNMVISYYIILSSISMDMNDNYLDFFYID